jgi:hypothetical protein
MPYIPVVQWSGEECPLHLRLINGVPVLFDDRGRSVSGQVRLTVDAGVNEMTTVTATILLERNEDGLE